MEIFRWLLNSIKRTIVSRGYDQHQILAAGDLNLHWAGHTGDKITPGKPCCKKPKHNGSAERIRELRDFLGVLQLTVLNTDEPTRPKWRDSVVDTEYVGHVLDLICVSSSMLPDSEDPIEAAVVPLDYTVSDHYGVTVNVSVESTPPTRTNSFIPSASGLKHPLPDIWKCKDPSQPELRAHCLSTRLLFIEVLKRANKSATSEFAEQLQWFYTAAHRVAKSDLMSHALVDTVAHDIGIDDIYRILVAACTVQDPRSKLKLPIDKARKKRNRAVTNLRRRQRAMLRCNSALNRAEYESAKELARRAKRKLSRLLKCKRRRLLQHAAAQFGRLWRANSNKVGWDLLNHLRGKLYSGHKRIVLDNIVDDDKDIADALAQHFQIATNTDPVDAATLESNVRDMTEERADLHRAASSILEGSASTSDTETEESIEHEEPDWRGLHEHINHLQNGIGDATHHFSAMRHATSWINRVITSTEVRSCVMRVPLRKSAGPDAMGTTALRHLVVGTCKPTNIKNLDQAVEGSKGEFAEWLAEA